jgi:MOSC domain-containing protein YiiM
MVRSPGPMRGGLGSGLVGDTIGNQKLHGGDDQAVYVYAREDLDEWEALLARPLGNGMFGENLTTSGVDVTDALIGERWRIGSDGPLLEVSAPRTPCRTFSAFLELGNWMKTFTKAAKPGAYLRVISPGAVRAGDCISIEHRPDHDVTIGLVFRARMSEPDLLPQLMEADALSSELKTYVRRRVRVADASVDRRASSSARRRSGSGPRRRRSSRPRSPGARSRRRCYWET